MDLVTRIKSLCQERGISLARLERTLGFAAGSICKWNQKVPSAIRVACVADYFNVSTDYLLGRGGREDASFRDIGRVYLSLAKTAQEAGVEPEDVETFLQLTRRIREKSGAK